MNSAATVSSSSSTSPTTQSPVVAPSASLPPATSLPPIVVGSDATTTIVVVKESIEIVSSGATTPSPTSKLSSSSSPQQLLSIETHKDSNSSADELPAAKLQNSYHPGNNRNRIGSSKGKHLTRSHAMRESASPPRTPTPRADQQQHSSAADVSGSPSSYDHESHQSSSQTSPPLNVPSSSTPPTSMEQQHYQQDCVKPVLPQIVSSDNGDPASQLDLDFPKLTAHKAKSPRHPSGNSSSIVAIDNPKSPSDALSPIMVHSRKQDSSRNASPCSQNSNRDVSESELGTVHSPLLSPSSYETTTSRENQRHSGRDHSKSPTTESRSPNSYVDRNSTGTNTGFSGSGLSSGGKKHKGGGGGGSGSKSTKPRLKAQGSSSSVEGPNSSNGNNSSVFMSKENSFDQFTDQSGVDLIKFFKETLNKNAKDRSMLLKIEKELYELAIDRTRNQVKFPSMSSYNRMLIHRCAAYFGMDHNVDASQTSVIAAVTKSTRIPEIRFDTLIRESMLLDEPRKSILKRDAHSFDECRQGLLPNPDRGLLDRKAKSFEEREEEYEKVRRRIFRGREMGGMGRGGDSNQHPDDQSSWPWSSSEMTDNSSRIKAQNNRLLKVHSLSVDTRYDRPCVSKSHSFGGYGGPPHHHTGGHPHSGGTLNRGDSITSTKSAGPRLYSKQDSLGSTNTPWRLSPSSSGYKTQTQSLRSDSITPSPTGYGSGDHTPEPTVQSPAATRSVVWAVTDMASVPRGSVLIDPQTLQPIVNQDGSIYYFDPSNLPPTALKSGNNFHMNSNNNKQHPFQQQQRKKMDKQKPGSFASSDSASNNIDVIPEDHYGGGGHQAATLNIDNGSQHTKEETTSPLNNESSNLDDESEVVINSSSGYDVKLLAVSRQQKHQATSPNIPQSPEINHSVTPPIVETTPSIELPLIKETAPPPSISPRSPPAQTSSLPPPLSSPLQNSCSSAAAVPTTSGETTPAMAAATIVEPPATIPSPSSTPTQPPLLSSSASLSPPSKVLAVTNRNDINNSPSNTSTLNNSNSKSDMTVSSSTFVIVPQTTPAVAQPAAVSEQKQKDEAPSARPNNTASSVVYTKPPKNNDNPSQELQQHHHQHHNNHHHHHHMHQQAAPSMVSTIYNTNSNPHYAVKPAENPNVIIGSNVLSYATAPTGYPTMEHFQGGANIPLSATTYQTTPDGSYMVYATYPSPMDPVAEMPGYYVPVYDQSVTPVIQTSREHTLMQASGTPIYQTTINGNGSAHSMAYSSGPIYATAAPGTGQIMYAPDNSQFATQQPPQQFPPYQPHSMTYNPYNPYNATATTYHPNYWAQPMTTYYVTPPPAPPAAPQSVSVPPMPMPIPMQMPAQQQQQPMNTQSNGSPYVTNTIKRGSPPQNGTNSNPPTPHSTSFTPNPFNSAATPGIPVQISMDQSTMPPGTPIYAIPAPVPMSMPPQGQNIYANMIPYSATMAPAAVPPHHHYPSHPPIAAQMPAYHQTPPPPFVPASANSSNTTFTKPSTSPPHNNTNAHSNDNTNNNNNSATLQQKSPPVFVPANSTYTQQQPAAVPQTVEKVTNPSTITTTPLVQDNNNNSSSGVSYEKKTNVNNNGGRKMVNNSHHLENNLSSYPSPINARPNSYNSSNSNNNSNASGYGKGPYVPNGGRNPIPAGSGNNPATQRRSNYGDNSNNNSNGVASSFNSNKPMVHSHATAGGSATPTTGVVILNQGGGGGYQGGHSQVYPGSEVKNQIRGPRPKPANLDLRRGGFHQQQHQGGHNYHHTMAGAHTNQQSQRNTPSTNSTESNNSPNSIASVHEANQRHYPSHHGQPPNAPQHHHGHHPVMVAMDQHHQQLISTAYNPSHGMYVKFGQTYFPHHTITMPSNRRSPPNEIRPQLAAGIYPMMLQAAPRHSTPRQNHHQNYKGSGGKSTAASTR